MWKGHNVLPVWGDKIGNDCLLSYYKSVNADLLITLCDSYALDVRVLSQMKVACWTPVDTLGPDPNETNQFAFSGATPLAMSQHAWRSLVHSGLVPIRIPHGVDTTVFTPEGDKRALREQAGVDPDAFIVGINAANTDLIRKGFPEQFMAFAIFQSAHPEAELMVHSSAAEQTALDLEALARACGIQPLFPDQVTYKAGMITARDMADWYRCLDILSNCSYAEGFGIPIIEAQACGIPVVVTDFGSMAELCGAGWKVHGEPFWVRLHQSWWCQPDVYAIAAAYEQAYTELKGD